ncbi:MAG: heat-inducible transcriptional repressor HrcA [Anaerolineae bacterium]
MSIDASHLPELTRRQEEILTLIVRNYTQNVEPVASKQLVDKLGVSSATIRNDMAALEELGYITAPHTSAGRVPTERGYRYFVKHLVTNGELTTGEQTVITEKLKQLPLVGDQWMRAAATLLARTARSAGLVTPPIAETSRFKHLELIAIQGRLVLMVLVLHGGMVQQRMLNLAEPVAQETLSNVATRLNTQCLDTSANELRMKSVGLSMLEREVTELAADLMDQTDGNPSRMIYREGLSEVIRSFQDQQGAQQAVRVFEERAFLETLLSEMLPSTMDAVQVFVAGEGREELNQVSIVLSRYGVPGQMSGAVGVLGPTHINYGRAISAVRFVSSLMTNMVTTLYSGADDDKLLPPGS